jgi:hypothetical protein
MRSTLSPKHETLIPKPFSTQAERGNHPVWDREFQYRVAEQPFPLTLSVTLRLQEEEEEEEEERRLIKDQKRKVRSRRY